MRCTGRPEVFGGYDGAGFAKLSHACQQFPLDFQVFGNDFNDPVGFRATRQVIIEVTDGNLSARAAVKNAAGLDFFAASKPARTILLRSPAGASAGKFGGTMSSKMQGSPAFAKCAAIREPMVPAPSTTAFSMRRS